MTEITFDSDGNWKFTGGYTYNNSWGIDFGKINENFYFPLLTNKMLAENFSKYFKPTHIIYSDPVTICFFSDGSKVMVRCAKNEKYIPENGVMACIVNKIFGNRTQFLKAVKSGYQQPTKKTK